VANNKGKEIRGIRKISTFVTADALLAAILMVWAQLWIQPSVRLWAAWYGVEKPEEVSKTLQTFNLNVGALGLLWTYFAVLLALLALVWVGFSILRPPSDKVPAPAIGLFSASVLMALVDVFQSICSVACKLLSSSSIWVPLSIHPWGWWLLGGAFVAIVAVSIWLACKYAKAKD
jgi:hypothetical protein